MEWKSTTQKGDDAITIPKRWIHIHYYEALNILFRTENALRVFVYVILKCHLHDKWSEAAIPASDEQQSTIAVAARKRIAQAKGFGYLGYEISCPLMHLNSGELTRLILSEAYWKYFQKYFRAKKEIIQTKLEEVGTVRNSLAHFRPIKYDDIELIKQNAKHALGGVEECLTELTRTTNVVPTNSTTEWYKALKTLGTERCALQLYQSKNEEWIRIELRFNSPVLVKNPYGEDFAAYRVLNLLSPKVLAAYPELAKLCVFGVEALSHTSMGENFDIDVEKQLSLVFDKAAIESQYAAIHEQLRALLLDIQGETELVQKDNLARGKLVEPVYIYASLKKADSGSTWWSFSKNNMNCAIDEDDPPEYWGEVGLYYTDFVSGTHRYPWMPSDVSHEESPFD